MADQLVDFKIDTNIATALERLKGVESEKWPGIIQKAANETGYYAVNKIKKEMPSFIDRPRPFTVNSFYLNPAGNRRGSTEAVLQWRDNAEKGTSAGKYLKPIVEGGNRNQKRFEAALTRAGYLPSGWVAVPTSDAPLDVNGNVPGPYITQILSYIRANPDALSNRRIAQLSRQSVSKLVKGYAKALTNLEKLEKREAKKKAKAARFVVLIQGRNGWTLPSGIYQRTTAASKNGTSFRRVFTFVSKATYRKTFPFYDLAEQAVRSKFADKLNEAITNSLAKK